MTYKVFYALTVSPIKAIYLLKSFLSDRERIKEDLNNLKLNELEEQLCLFIIFKLKPVMDNRPTLRLERSNNRDKSFQINQVVYPSSITK